VEYGIERNEALLLEAVMLMLEHKDLLLTDCSSRCEGR
jgi:hypothetical protein